jgi:aspartate aminotransferase
MVNQEYYTLGTAPSVIRQLFAYGLEQAKVVGPENVYDYSLGNPSIPAPKKVNDSIKKIVDETDSIKLHGYSMAPGFEEARAAVAKDLAARFGLDVKASELFFTCGAAPALISIIKALIVDADTEIMAIAPFFPEYRPFVNANGGKLVVVPADTKAFQIHLDEVEKRITKHTQAIIVNSPNNPSGVVYTEETLKGLAALLERKSAEYGHPIYIIADEPYRELVYGGVKVPFIPCIYKNTIVCYSYSKSLSLPGERIGYVYVPGFADDSHDVYAAISGAARIMGHVCPPTLMQKVIECCAEERPDLVAYDENRNLLYNSLTEMGYECAKPDGAFYLFVKAPNGDANAFSEKAKLGHNLLVVPADGFGCPGFFRLSYCVSNDMIRRSLPAFKAMIESYK